MDRESPDITIMTSGVKKDRVLPAKICTLVKAALTFSNLLS
jgi:hypothetical protein